AASQVALESADTHRALSILGRIRTILKICVAQIDILETMTPLQFNSFRSRLGESSGFQSAQFREVEAILGRRDKRAAAHLLPKDRDRVERWMASSSLWDSVLRYVNKRGYQIPTVLRYVNKRGYQIPNSILNRDVTKSYEPNPDVQDVLIELHRKDLEAGLVFERLVDIDEGLQEWRYRHVKMVERTIGRKSGTGGSAGADYLRQTLFTPIFPDLWEIRNRF
ncbi:MAG: hypothetical protein RL159_390, partial [Actinomycetota bacterium]